LLKNYQRKKFLNAIHAATAILNGEREIITDDADFDKVKELRRISLADASRLSSKS